MGKYLGENRTLGSGKLQPSGCVIERTKKKIAKWRFSRRQADEAREGKERILPWCLVGILA